MRKVGHFLMNCIRNLNFFLIIRAYLISFSVLFISGFIMMQILGWGYLFRGDSPLSVTINIYYLLSFLVFPIPYSYIRSRLDANKKVELSEMEKLNKKVDRLADDICYGDSILDKIFVRFFAWFFALPLYTIVQYAFIALVILSIFVFTIASGIQKIFRKRNHQISIHSPQRINEAYDDPRYSSEPNSESTYWE